VNRVLFVLLHCRFSISVLCIAVSGLKLMHISKQHCLQGSDEVSCWSPVCYKISVTYCSNYFCTVDDVFMDQLSVFLWAINVLLRHWTEVNFFSCLLNMSTVSLLFSVLLFCYFNCIVKIVLSVYVMAVPVCTNGFSLSGWKHTELNSLESSLTV